MRWTEFIQRLETEVDWHDPEFTRNQAPILETILLAAKRDPMLLSERVQDIIGTPEIFSRLAAHCDYPRMLMDKFVIHIDDDARFRVRLHRFKTRIQNGNLAEVIHSHKWNCSTVILRGSYTERQFRILELDEDSHTAHLEVAEKHTLTPGTTNSLPVDVPHQVINESDDAPCITLFVRGPSLRRSARIFDVSSNSFDETFTSLTQIKVGLLHMGNLDPDFAI
jgi:hypothetical protein